MSMVKNKTKVVTLRFTEKMYQAVTIRAVELGMTVSDYLRWVVQKDTKKVIKELNGK